MKRVAQKFLPLVLIFVLLALLVVYLLFSDRIYSHFMGSIGFTKISEEILTKYDTQQKVTAYFDILKVRKDALGEDLKTYGYAYIPTQLDSKERNVKIILASKGTIYEAPINLWVREDLLNSMRESNINHTSTNLGLGGIGAQAGAGAGAALSLLTVDEGIYRVGIYVYENEQEYGICWMPVYLKKTVWGGSEIYYGEQTPNFENLEESSTASATILTVRGQKDYYYIPGYAYDTEIGPNNQNVYIEATAPDGSRMTYLALPNDSKQNSYFPDESYTDNSFVARIPMELMPTGMVQLRVVLEDKETNEAVYAFEELYRIEEGEAQLYRGEVVENFEEAEPSETAQATVLNVFDTQDYYYIPGYAYDTEIGPNNQNVYVEFTAEDGTQTTVLALNTDSTGLDYFPDASYRENSFSAYMPKDIVGDGIYDIRVYIENQTDGTVVRAYESVWQIQNGQTEPYRGELVDNFEMVGDSDTSRAAILTIWYLDQSYYYIPGYAYDEEIGANNQTVYLELENSEGERITYKAITTDSTGIDYFPDSSYTRNSFTAKIPEELLPDGAYAIRTIIQDKSSGRTVYAPGALNCTILAHEIIFQ